MRLGYRLNVDKLLHQLFIYMQTTRGIYDDKIIAVVACVLETFLNDLAGIYLSHLKNGHLSLLADYLQLLDSSGSINVSRDEQGTHLFGALEMLSELCRMGRFTRTL